jgi:hypothetical protein
MMPRSSDRVDAVLWLGPTDTLTRSRADPALYQSGAYAEELARRSLILSAYDGEPVDLVAQGLALAMADSALNASP